MTLVYFSQPRIGKLLFTRKGFFSTTEVNFSAPLLCYGIYAVGVIPNYSGRAIPPPKRKLNFSARLRAMTFML